VLLFSPVVIPSLLKKMNLFLMQPYGKGLLFPMVVEVAPVELVLGKLFLEKLSIPMAYH
jgi:hypothetical protein